MIWITSETAVEMVKKMLHNDVAGKTKHSAERRRVFSKHCGSVQCRSTIRGWQLYQLVWTAVGVGGGNKGIRSNKHAA